MDFFDDRVDNRTTVDAFDNYIRFDGMVTLLAIYSGVGRETAYENVQCNTCYNK